MKYDLSEIQSDLRGYRFMAVSVSSIESRKVLHWTVLCKQTGREHKWATVSLDGWTLVQCQTEQEAKDLRRGLEDLAKRHRAQAK